MSKSAYSEYIYDNWARMPIKLMSDPRYTPTAKLILCFLLDKAKNGEELKIRIGIKKISEGVACSERAVNNALKELEQWGLVNRIRTGRTSVYEVCKYIIPPIERRE